MGSKSLTPKNLVRRWIDTDLMLPPPPAKRLKRPKEVLHEDDYTSALSHIIARDFFPGIKASEAQNEYLDAVESRNIAWISSAGHRLQESLTPRRRHVQSICTHFQDCGRATSSCVSSTSNRRASMTVHEMSLTRTNMKLSEFQKRYTSEDNESFYKLLDKKNQKRAEKNAWMWNNSKLPSNQMLKQEEVRGRLAQKRNLVDDGFKRDRLAVRDSDERPARPDTWNAAPRNGLMFEPEGLEDGVVTVAQKCEESSRMPPRCIAYENTRMPQTFTSKRSPSPTMSSIRDAAAGRPRGLSQCQKDADGSKTPGVNGYSFVDEDDESTASHRPSISLSASDGRNPFKIQEQRKRESLHERLVERISRSKKESSRHGLVGKFEINQVPKFSSSPRIPGNFTPAAQRIISKMGTPRRTPSSPFDHSFTQSKPRSSLLKPVARLGSKRQV